LRIEKALFIIIIIIYTVSRTRLMLTVAAFDCETAGRGVWYLVRATVFHGRSLLVGRVRSCDFETET